MQAIRDFIDGDFEGFDDCTVFKLQNGQVWQQIGYHYHYHYAYCPAATITLVNGCHMLQVEGVPVAIPVTEVSAVTEGTIVSPFKGFKQNELFQFNNGQVWQQAEHKYAYHYAHRPSAVIVSGQNGYELQVEGMSEPVRVRRVR